jgi:glycerol-3-phosphate acyltransferase PlsX
VLGAAKHFRLLPGIRRAALACVHLRMTEYPGQDPLALLLDVGATVRCEAEELVHFALMGGAYARRISKVSNPRVGLLNMGTEEVKGGPVLVEAHRRLRGQAMVDFIGNVEGNDLVRGRADVIVCEGYVGNVVLKLLEGVSEVLVDVTQAAAERKLVWRVGLRLLSQGIERVHALTDFSRYGGSPILGFDRLFIKCHGRSRARAVANAVKVAAKAVRDRVPAEIADAVGGGR